MWGHWHKDWLQINQTVSILYKNEQTYPNKYTSSNSWILITWLGRGWVGGGWQRWVTVINGSWFRWTRDHRLASFNMALGRATSNLVCNKPGCPAPHNHHRHTLHRCSWLGLKAGLVVALIYLPILSSLTVDPTNESTTGIRGFTKPREWNCWGSQGNPGSQPTHSSTPNSGLLGWERNLVWMYHQYSPPHNNYTIGHYHCHWPIETRSALVTVLKPGLVFNAYLLRCALILDFSLFQPSLRGIDAII